MVKSLVRNKFGLLQEKGELFEELNRYTVPLNSAVTDWRYSAIALLHFPSVTGCSRVVSEGMGGNSLSVCS